MSSPCPPIVLFLWGSPLGKKLAAVSGRGPVLLMFFYCLLVVRCPSSSLHWPRLPAYLRSYSSHHRLVFLLSSLPLLLLFSSWHAPLMLSCGAFGVVRSQLVLLLSSWCLGVFVLFVFPHPFVLCCPSSVHMSSSGLSVVLLLSCFLRCFPGTGWGCVRPRQQ